MMIKKQLGVLAGSVLLASGAQSAIVSNNVLAVFVGTGDGTYIVDTGVTASDFAGGTGFTLDVSAAVAGLGGAIDSYALFGFVDLDPGTETAYNYDSGSYVDVGAGLVYASSAPSALGQLSLTNSVAALQAYLDEANFGLNNDGTLADADANTNIDLNALNVLAGAAGTRQVWTQVNTFTGANGDLQQVTLTTPTSALEDVNLIGSDFTAHALGGGPVIPVPAAAWLFGSALVGLGVVRRKK